jgi:hypothetical protein
MKFIDNMKAKSAAKALAQQNQAQLAAYQNELIQWQANKDLGEAILAAFKAVADRTDAVHSGAVMKAGEYAIWSGGAGFHESRAQPGQYVGRSAGLSIPLGHGFRYRTGATRGTFVPGEQVQMNLDAGTVILTTDRVIFNGRIKTQEWAFAKWTGSETSSDERYFMFHVNNRQKASGISFLTSREGNAFNYYLGFALQLPRDGASAVLKEIKEAYDKNESEKPVAPALLTE